MGKQTGFMDYERVEDPERNPAERINDFNEFHLPASAKVRKEQGGRCMDCGVPFCQAELIYKGQRQGCPLNNLIPEWNDMVWLGNIEHAVRRLLKTNCFPEFTGRVCPALCERACTCNMIDKEPVTIHNNELYIIEKAFREGYIKPSTPQVRSDKKVAVIGSGPAGLSVAFYLNRRGHNVTVFERDVRPGGLLMYGIPNMKLPKDIVERRISLLEEEGIVFKTGVDVGRDITPEELKSQFDAVVLCCGAQKAREVPFDGKVESGVVYALDYLKSATLALQGRPHEILTATGKNVIVIGAGDSASDCVGTALRQGCASLTQVIRKPASYYEGMKESYAHKEALAVFGKEIREYESRVTAIIAGEDGRLQQAVITGPDGDKTVAVDEIIIASGFTGCEDYVNDLKAALGEEGVFVAGDMQLGASLVVRAMADGRKIAVETDKYLMGYTNMD